MINTLLGVLVTVLLFSTHFIAYKLGFKQRKYEKVERLSEQEKEVEDRRSKGMENILNYDYEVAIGKRRN